MNENPSSPAPGPVPAGPPSAVEIRRRHIKHEASVTSIGVLYYFSAIVFVAGGIWAGFFTDEESLLSVPANFAAFLVGVGLFFGWVGRGLRTLKPWARLPTGLLSGIGLLGFPTGTIINGYILYLVFSKKGSTVFSEEYKEVRAATPEVHYRTSLLIWILLGLLLLLIGCMAYLVLRPLLSMEALDF